MSTEIYGVIPPKGIRKAWEPSSMLRSGPGQSGDIARRYGTPATWGDPEHAVGWFTDDGCLRVLVCDYENGRRAIVRSGARNWQLTMTARPQGAA